MDRLLKLLSVGGELLDAGFTLHVPQTNGAVVACRGDSGLGVAHSKWPSYWPWISLIPAYSRIDCMST